MKSKMEITHVCDCKMCNQPILVIKKDKKAEPEIAFTCRCYEGKYYPTPVWYPYYRWGVWCSSSIGTTLKVDNNTTYAVSNTGAVPGINYVTSGKSEVEPIDLKALVDSGEATYVKKF